MKSDNPNSPAPSSALTAQTLREALVAAVPWLFEHGHHVNPQCYRGSDDGCCCGLDEAKKIVEAALAGAESGVPLDKKNLDRL